ncbi:hypothetical protein FOZ60_010513 [Perkinsus olseni]|uniref:Uncharacterized protein n=3 Tax=Perkinsus olseni TaxID=32597 RepID=A0A7J6PBP5_PEROL|nr:hypothetical protein FOZ60_010513 [Perkinsus olseni]
MSGSESCPTFKYDKMRRPGEKGRPSALVEGPWATVDISRINVEKHKSQRTYFSSPTIGRGRRHLIRKDHRDAARRILEEYRLEKSERLRSGAVEGNEGLWEKQEAEKADLLTEQGRLRTEVSELKKTIYQLRKALSSSVELLKVKNAEWDVAIAVSAFISKMTGSTPLLQHMSPYKASPKWTIKGEGCVEAQKRLDRHANDAPGPGKYDVIGKVDQTSKFKCIARACSFGSASRFVDDRKRPISAPARRDKSEVEPGPGAYSPPSDFSSKPYDSQVSISFGTGGRLFPKCMERLARNAPGPGIYEADTTGTTIRTSSLHEGSQVLERTTWTSNPTKPCMKFGTSKRPPIYRISSKGQPGPGAYDVKTTLAGLKYSFTGSSKYGGALFTPNELPCMLIIALLSMMVVTAWGSIAIPAVHVAYTDDVRGHFDFGYQVGYALRDHIQAAVKIDVALMELVDWHRISDEAQEWLRLYSNSARKAYPKTHAEMRGLSRGTGLPMDTVLLANHRNEMKLLMARSNQSVAEKRVERGCTDVHWRRDGWVGWAHNEDYDWPMSHRPGYIIYATVYDPIEAKVRQRWAAYTYPLGLSGLAVSVNSDGIVSTVNALYPTDLIVPTELQPALGQAVVGRQLCWETIACPPATGITLPTTGKATRPCCAFDQLVGGDVEWPADLLKILSDSGDAEWPIFRDRESAVLQKDSGTTDFTAFITLSGEFPRIQTVDLVLVGSSTLVCRGVVFRPDSQIWTDRPWNRKGSWLRDPGVDEDLGFGPRMADCHDDSGVSSGSYVLMS